MNRTLIRACLIAAVLGAAPAAYAAGLDGLKYVTEHSHKMKSGKTVTVMVGEMNGHKMAIVPMEELNDLFERAEGHSMTVE
jgi:hypothetical protein